MKNKVLGIVSVVAGIAIIIAATQLQVAMVAEGDPGPKVFPIIAAVLFLVCGAAVFFQKPDPNEKPFLTKEQWKRLGILFAVLIGYMVLMYFFGFLISTMIALFVVCTLFSGEKKTAWWIRVLYGVVLGFLVWYMLEKMFMVPLPAGILFE